MVSYMLKHFFRLESKDICKQLHDDKEQSYAITHGNEVSFVAISPARAVELGIIPDTVNRRPSPEWRNMSKNEWRSKRG